jgi:anti-sigma factor RsiW
MNCTDVRRSLLDHRRGRLAPDLGAEVTAHLEGCAECRRADAGEGALDALLEQRLPRRAAPAALKRSLEARWADAPASPAAAPPVAARPRRVARMMIAVAAAAVIAVGSVAAYRQLGAPPQELAAADRLVGEAVNDHLRVLYSEHPLEVESGGIHQVKPWFQGRLDFAPVVDFAGDADFPLQGGAVGYFLDRKAAVFVFKRRLHTISLLVFRADGLPWQAGPLRPMGRARARVEKQRGFNVVLWRDGELGYALASDVNLADLLELGAKVAGPG